MNKVTSTVITYESQRDNVQYTGHFKVIFLLLIYTSNGRYFRKINKIFLKLLSKIIRH